MKTDAQPAPRRRRHAKLSRPLAVMASAYLLYLILLFCFQRQLLFPGTHIKVEPSPPAVAGLERLLLETPAGKFETLLLPQLARQTATKAPALIFAHGNGEVVDDWLEALDGFRERGFFVVLPEYPGYGRATGRTSSASIREAMLAAYDRLAADPRVDSSRIVGFGDSLGGGAICALARERKLRALILYSTFPSLDIFAPAFLMRDQFDNVGALRSYAGPVLVMHGRADNLVPWRQAQRLAAASTNAIFKLYDCGHGVWLPDHLPLWRDIDEFLARASPLPGEGAGLESGAPGARPWLRRRLRRGEGGRAPL